jgi:hypothetical protein
MAEGSLAYRKARNDIWAGRIPEKFTRLLPYIQGSPVLEIGSAEGVLTLTLAKQGLDVIGLELRPDRHEDALRLKKFWGVTTAKLICGDIRDRLHLLAGTHTLVAVRAIYYLRADAAGVLAHASASGVQRVVLCGNKNRAAQSAEYPLTDLGRFNHVAGIPGMVELLEGAGYRIEAVVKEGDPIVVGVR